jgi:hypothetical protein
VLPYAIPLAFAILLAVMLGDGGGS